MIYSHYLNRTNTTTPLETCLEILPVIDQLHTAYMRGQLSLDELFICKEEVYAKKEGRISQREMQRFLIAQIGEELGCTIVGFYLISAYKRLKEGKEIADVIQAAKQRVKDKKKQARISQMRRRFMALEFN